MLCMEEDNSLAWLQLDITPIRLHLTFTKPEEDEKKAFVIIINQVSSFFIPFCVNLRRNLQAAEWKLHEINPSRVFIWRRFYV